MKFDFLSESDQAYFIHKASTLVEALPYIRKHSGKIIVIKYGGHTMGNVKLAKTDWWSCSDLTMTQSQKDYRKALRDLPATAEPKSDENRQLTNVTWPEKPE